jgi:hypothetical protein
VLIFSLCSLRTFYSCFRCKNYYFLIELEPTYASPLSHSAGLQTGPRPMARGRNRPTCGGTAACCAAQQPPGPPGSGATRSARTACGHRTVATRATVGWRGRQCPTGREEGEVSGKAEPAGTHRGGGATTGRRGRLETTTFRWRANPVVVGGLGGGPTTRGGGEGGCWRHVGAKRARGLGDKKIERRRTVVTF